MSDLLHQLVPGGCHTYSKGDDRYPPNAPRLLVHGKGGMVRDDKDRQWIDWTMGINNVLVGHAEPEIDDAAVAALRNGQAFGRPSDLEPLAAAAVLSLHPQGEMIKFCKNGSDANNAAVRLARAITGRQHIAYDETAPFFSISDWFVGGWPHQHAGTLDAERAFVHSYKFNDAQSVLQVLDRWLPAAFVVELARTEKPTERFLDMLRMAQSHGCLLIVDEIVTGYRFAQHGIAPVLGMDPDLFTLGKGMANGYALAALCGKRAHMEHGRAEVFLLSTTNGAERSALAAAIATVNFYCAHDVIGVLANTGARFMRAVNDAAVLYGITDRFRADSAFGCRPMLSAAPHLKMAFCTALAGQGVLLPTAWVCPCYRRTEDEMQRTEDAIKVAVRTVAAQP
jgi:glutamate-1-semialdehyde 2,1-aminomutase